VFAPTQEGHAVTEVFGITRDDVIAEIRAIAETQWGVDPEEIEADTRLSDLPGIDVEKHSAAVELLERNYDITFPDGDQPAETIGAFADQVMEGLAERN